MWWTSGYARSGGPVGIWDCIAPPIGIVPSSLCPSRFNCTSGLLLCPGSIHATAIGGIKTLYIDPGSPWQNGYIESFHSRFRDECLNREWLLNLREARVVIEDWRQHYNTERPHSQLGYLSPEGFINSEKVSP